ncbi:Phosphatidylethanolamine-binding protein 1 [Orchesella cincta]|uniref:Phosphatidylethanolamine-binding protein 1 n=1 Tax=Orchesella cincta TaxID=48709 RepID=A0A1D2M9G1_ORCCI|nr:Phosphatidylethanolamine-binding protein 1 [Orchesella cincta]
MEKEKIVPDVIDTAPKAVLNVKYGALEVKLGNTLTPTQVKSPPTITWNADPKKFYLLCLTDPDAPSRKEPTYRGIIPPLACRQHPGTEIAKGDTLTEYVGSGPPQGTGLHRYVFLIYEQPGKLTFDEKRISNRSEEGRGKFSIRNFAKKYKLGQPIAGISTKLNGTTTFQRCISNCQENNHVRRTQQ